MLGGKARVFFLAFQKVDGACSTRGFSMCFSASAFACIKFHAMALEQVVSQGVGVRSASWSQGWGFGCFGVGGSRGGGGG